MEACRAEQFYDGLKQQCDEYNFVPRSYPSASVRLQDESSIALDSLNFLVALDRKHARVYSVFSILEWEAPAQGVDLATHARAIATHGTKKLMELPEGLRPVKELPVGTSMSLVVSDAHDGCKRWVVQHFVFSQALHASAVLPLLTGTGKVAPFRPNTLGANKNSPNAP